MLFDVGITRYALPPRMDDTVSLNAWGADLQRVREESAAAERGRNRRHPDGLL
jgi:type II restriction enzyme